QRATIRAGSSLSNSRLASSRLGNAHATDRSVSKTNARARARGHSLRRRFVSYAMRAPAARAVSIAAKHVSHADAEIAWLIADRCSTRVWRSTSSGSAATVIRDAADP